MVQVGDADTCRHYDTDGHAHILRNSESGADSYGDTQPNELRHVNLDSDPLLHADGRPDAQPHAVSHCDAGTAGARHGAV